MPASSIDPFVIDANLLLALMLPLPYSDEAERQIRSWRKEGRVLIAPALIAYEVASGLRRAVSAGWVSTSEASELLRQLSQLRIEEYSPDLELSESALRWAERLGQSKAYDGQYLALAERFIAELWTSDKRLFERIRQVGGIKVCWIGNTQS